MTITSGRAAISFREGSHTQADNNKQDAQNGILEPKRVAIYTRSAVAQAEDDHLSVQLEACRRYCFERGYKLQEQHIYQDIGSGSEYKARPQLAALKEAVGRHEFDVVVVYRYDRLSRNYTHQAMIIGEMEQLGIDVESVSDPVEDDVIGILLRYAYDIAQQIEREKLIERMKRGREGARRQREQQ